MADYITYEYDYDDMQANLNMYRQVQRFIGWQGVVHGDVTRTALFIYIPFKPDLWLRPGDRIYKSEHGLWRQQSECV